MNVLIVFAHNEPRSFNAAMKDEALRVLEGEGHQVQVSDLYAMNFNPVASAADFGSRANPDYLVYALEQRHAFNTGTLAPDIAAERAEILDGYRRHLLSLDARAPLRFPSLADYDQNLRPKAAVD